MAEDLSLIVQNLIDRTKALVAIQELHVPYVNKSAYKTCMLCGITWPCITRRLADEGLGDNLARTTKNGDAP